ncbi:unnamed protein product [Prorocentrum cordatum]|uniref:KH domain-containing protein n=1 Tax=Prorocentrum cordatum TaxID=2364126 RepID=A0ABN9WEB2_9DINO|nr:unnamed protein product [Polarella glacialis]
MDKDGAAIPVWGGRADSFETYTQDVELLVSGTKEEEERHLIGPRLIRALPAQPVQRKLAMRFNQFVSTDEHGQPVSPEPVACYNGAEILIEAFRRSLGNQVIVDVGGRTAVIRKDGQTMSHWIETEEDMYHEQLKVYRTFAPDLRDIPPDQVRGVLLLRKAGLSATEGASFSTRVNGVQRAMFKLRGQDYDDGDLTMLQVPQEAVGFVTGRAGNFLRTIEEEWGTLMFFCEVGTGRNREYEKLAIFGGVRGRRGAELKVLSAVETKVPGYYDRIKESVVTRDKGRDDSGTWGTDTMTFQDDELSYALGKQGGTRKKLERSSGAIVQYVGHNALFSGARPERKRAKEYMAL